MSPVAPVTIVVPVYNAPADLRQCVESILAHTPEPHRLVLIDDGSTDQGVRAFFDELAARRLEGLSLLANPANLGFTKTANRGFAFATDDVVLLNSDTIVTRGWLSALLRCAASDCAIGTVTPFSNNAEICSFPRFCENNRWIAGRDPEPVRKAIARTAVPTYPDLPTGVGFCLYVRRAALDAIGAFDEAFGAGYGEENDLCMRAAAAGFRNVLCDDAFVLHTGERSFEGRKRDLGRTNLALLLERHPAYLDLVRAFIAQDPIAPLREAARSALAIDESTVRGVLHVVHHHGGGTERHVRGLIAASKHRFRHYLAIAVGDRWQIEDHRADGSTAGATFERRVDESWAVFVGGICRTFRVDLLHLHNISACRDGVIEALDATRIPYGYTAHDLNFACPTITFVHPATKLYCGAQTDPATCAQCLGAQPDFAGIDIERWRPRHRELLERAAFVIAPSEWANRIVRRYFPSVHPVVVPHGTPRRLPRTGHHPPALSLPADGVPTVGILGAIGPDKGARRIERLVELARARHANVRFVLIGYLDVQLTAWQSEDARLTVHGRYQPGELRELLAHYRVGLVLFPSAGPETFSYTLSEAWQSGYPVLVPPIGALAERVDGSGAGFVMSDDEWRDEARMLDRIESLLTGAGVDALRTAALRACGVAQPTVDAMTERTLAEYDRVPAADVARFAAFDNARVRDAFGYRPWSPPVATPHSFASPPSPPQGRFARAVVRVRQTAFGRIAYQWMPRRMLSAMRSRLR